MDEATEEVRGAFGVDTVGIILASSKTMHGASASMYILGSEEDGRV